MVHVKSIAEKLGKSEKTIYRRVEELGETVQRGYVTDEIAGKILTAEKPAPIVVTSNTTTPYTAPTKKPQPKINTGLFQDNAVGIVAAVIIIATDAISFGWIAWNSYHDFQIPAAIVFAFAGVAVGYSAIRNTVTYSGWNGDGWAWGFGIFQVLLHMCAMEVIPHYSFMAGKVIIALGLALGTLGLAVSFRKKEVKP
jgi:hypothetical protein